MGHRLMLRRAGRPPGSGLVNFALRRLRASQAGLTLIEASMALALGGLLLASLFSMNSETMILLRANKQTTASAQCLQERVEQLRLSNWLQITDPNYVKLHVFDTATGSAAALPDLTETMTISPYRLPSDPSTVPLPTAFTVTRAGSTVTVSPALSADQITALQKEKLVRIAQSVQWTARQNANRTRQEATIISKGGMTR